MVIIPGILMLLNGIYTHFMLTNYSKSYNQLSGKDKNETVGRINCTLYQIYIIYRIFFTLNEFSDIVEINNKFISIMLCDMIHYLFYVNQFSHYLHHIITIIILLIANSGYSNYEDVINFMRLTALFESTNPPMAISWLGNKFGYSNYLLFKIIGTFTFLYWSFIRIFYFSYSIYQLNNYEHQLLAIPFLGLNFYWFKALVNIYLKLLVK